MAIIKRGTPGDSPRWEWADVPPQTYAGGGAVGSTRRVLIGPDDGAGNFSLRYFEIAPGGQTSFDKHAHDHGVMIVKGRARVRLGWKVVEMDPGDVVYIAPQEEHQFEAIGPGPVGMLCVNPAKKNAAGL